MTPGDPAWVRCPSCGQPTPGPLGLGETCPACEARGPWTDRASPVPARRVVVTRREIEQAERRRLGYRPRTQAATLLITLVGPLLALLLAVVAVAEMIGLLLPQEPEDLPAVLATLSGRGLRVLVCGLAAVLLGAGLLLVLRKSRFHRAWVPLSLVLTALPCGVVGTVGGAMFWSASRAYAFQHSRMPPIPETLQRDPRRGRMARAQVAIYARDPGGSLLLGGLGSGTIVSRQGPTVGILTASHVALPDQSPSAFREADPSRVLVVTFSDGRQARATLTWVAPPPLDLAILSARLERAPEPVPIAPDPEVLAEDAVMTFCAHPYRRGWTFHTGRIVARKVRHTPAGRFSLIITDLPVDHGDSGSGLYDARGRLAGVVTMKFSEDGAPRGISLPSDALIRFFQFPEGEVHP